MMRGPAPLALPLARVIITSKQEQEVGGIVLLSPWDGEDFRSGSEPWWQ